MRYLRLLAVEAYVATRALLRYPLDAVSGIVIMYALYMGIFFAGTRVVGAVPSQGAVTNSIVSYSTWYLALLAISSIGQRISMEAQRGTIEQLFLAAAPTQLLLILRAIGEAAYSLVIIFVVAALLSWSTGVVIPFGWVELPILLITLTGLWGFGLCLAGVTLLVKQATQLITLVQFGLLPVALNSQVGILAYFPLTIGIRNLVAGPDARSIGLLVVVCAAWLALGIAVFGLCTARVKSVGSLGHH